jgi:protein TilB
MPRLSVALIRTRAEHNEGCLDDLKEVTLHQQEIEKIEVIGDACRELEIIYLCNNFIQKIEGLNKLKFLSYLNLAVNSIAVVEGLEGCEMLKKLDLTLNFIKDPSSLANLRANPFLETLMLTGNACTSTDGYRAFVVQALPQLVALDGEEVVRSEQILARQDDGDNREAVDMELVRTREELRLKNELIAKGIDPFPAKFDEKGERVYGHSAEERVQILRESQRKEAESKERGKVKSKFTEMAEEMNRKPVKRTPEEEIELYGEVRMKNEGGLAYTLEEPDDTCCVLDVQPGKFISTTLITVDAQPTYIRVVVKEKTLLLRTPVDIAPDKTRVERSATTGRLKITMPVALHVEAERKKKKSRFTELDDDDE